MSRAISKIGSPNQILQGGTISIPTFEIASNPTIKLSDIKARRFYIVDRSIIPSVEWWKNSKETYERDLSRWRHRD